MNNTTVNISLIGIPAQEHIRLNAAFDYTLKRKNSYATTQLFNSPSILIVNADEQSALIKWQQYRNDLESQCVNEPSTIFVSRNNNLTTKFYRLRRPLIASRVISTLDKISQTELDLTQEVACLNQDNVSPTVTPANGAHLEHDQEIAILTQDNAPITVAQTEATTSANSYSVLVIDDSLPVRIQMDQALKPYAKHVDFATCAEEAYKYVNTNKYDVIFLDIILPDIDGYEICKVIKQGRAKNTPVIMLTSNSSSSDRIKGKLAGCDTYLIKPVRQDVFYEVLQQYLKNPATTNTATA